MTDKIMQNFYRGDTPEYPLYFSQKQPDGSFEPVSVEGYVVALSLKKNEDDTEYAMQLTANGSEADPDNPEGYILLEAAPEDTNIEPGGYFYDLQVSWTANAKPKVKTIEKGHVKVLSDITRES